MNSRITYIKALSFCFVSFITVLAKCLDKYCLRAAVVLTAVTVQVTTAFQIHSSIILVCCSTYSVTDCSVPAASAA